MKFAIPQMLWLLVVAVPLLALFLLWAQRKRTALALQFVQLRLLPQLTLGRTATRARLRIWLQTVAVCLVFLALARPQWGFTWDEARQRGLDILVAIDTSRSMLATDLAPNRLTRSKLAALDLLKLAKTDRLGLIAFAGTAFLQCPLTLDDFAFRESINALNVGIIPHGGSALAEAIDAALAAFEGDPENHRVLIVFSDGEDHEDTALAAAEKASKAGLKIFTVGVGTAAGELVRQSDVQGGSDWVRDNDGNAVKSRLNETLLQQIATAAQGFYIPLRGANTMETLYQQGLAPLPKAEINARMIQRFHERFQWPLALAVILLLLDSLVRDVPRPPRPRKLPLNSPSPRTATLLAIALVFATSAARCQASTSQAAAEYQQGRFPQAQQQYEELLKKRPDDSALAYNAGTAAYKASDLEAAARNFETAARAKDLKLQQQSLYNLGNTLFRQGEGQQDPKQISALWERAIRSYENALKLQPQDTDAEFNRDLVRQRLEQLKQQQQQQQQQDQQQQDDKEDSKDSKDSKDGQDDKKSDSSKDSKKEQEQPQPNPGDPSKQDQEKDKANKPSDSKQPSDQDQSSKQEPEQGQDNQTPQDQAGQPKSKSKQPNPGSGDKPEDGGDPADAQAAAQGTVAMNLQQARQLLEAHRAEERALIFTNTLPRRNPPRLLKDW